MRRCPEHIAHWRRPSGSRGLRPRLSTRRSLSEADVPTDPRGKLAQPVQPRLTHDISPTRLPLSARRDKLFKTSCEEQMAECPPGVRMADDDDTSARPLACEIRSAVAYAIDHLTI